MQKVPHVSKVVSPALPLLQAGAAEAASVRAGAKSTRSVERAASMGQTDMEPKKEGSAADDRDEPHAMS